MFFPPADLEEEARLIPHARYTVIDSLWAHFTMFCMNDRDKAAIDTVFAELLAD